MRLVHAVMITAKDSTNCKLKKFREVQHFHVLVKKWQVSDRIIINCKSVEEIMLREKTEDAGE